MAFAAPLALAGSVAAGGLGAVSSIMKGQSQSAQYGYQSGIAQMNQKIAKQNAAWAREAGEDEAGRIGMKTRERIGNQLVAQSGSGLDVGFGSAKRVRESTRAIGMGDQNTTRTNAARRAYGFDVQAAQYEAQSEAYSSAAEDAETAGYIGAISSIIGGATSVSSKWMQGSQIGLWSGSGGGSGGILGELSGSRA